MKKLFLLVSLLPTFSCLPGVLKSSEIKIRHEERIERDKEAAKKLANLLFSPSLLKDVKKIVVRSKKPAQQCLQGVFYHMDFHKHQLVGLKECIGELATIVKAAAIPVCDYCLDHADAPETQQFMAVLTDIYIPQGGSVSQEDQEQLTQAALALSARIENDPREADITKAIDQLNDWQEKWTPFIVSLLGYMQARGQTFSAQLTKHVQSMATSVAFANFWFIVKCFFQKNSLLKLAPTFDGDQKRQALYSAALVKYLYANAIARKAQVHSTVQENIVNAIQEGVAVINQVIDDSMKRSR